jgi:serine/threonine protein kinase/WD40 repeat protein
MVKLDEPQRCDTAVPSLHSEVFIVSRAEPVRSNVADNQTTELVQILDAYLADLQAGVRPDRERLLAEHPQLAEPLRECLEGIDFLNQQGSTAAPERLGDFRILREVGRGGMGIVYEAEQISLKRRVALKVLRYGGSGPEAMQRFRREAETVAELHHTNIVPIFAIGCEDDVHYYAMQFIDGSSLAQLAEQAGETGKPIAPRDLAGWALQASEALAHAHQRGVVHRDVKPSNLILDPGGRIWLTDFGLAKRADDVTLSIAGALLGTPRYMSPEQAEAMSRPVDHRTDIYSLGATLYELAVGGPIFQADSPHAVITQILKAEPPAIRTLNPAFPRDLETIILKCLAKEPHKRYQTAVELAEDLRAFLDERPILARRTSWMERARRWSRRNPLAAGLSAALLFALLSGLGATTGFWSLAEQRREQAEQSAQAAQQERSQAEERLWDSLYEQARAERLSGNRWRSLELLAEARQMKSAPQLRQEAIQTITAPGVRLISRLGPQDSSYGGDTPRAAFSFDSGLVANPTQAVPTATGGETAGVKVWDVTSGRLVGQTPCTNHPLSFAFSPVARLLAVTDEDDTVRLWDPDTGETISSFPGRSPLHFSQDGRLLAVRSATGIEVRDIPHGHAVWTLSEGMPVGFAGEGLLLVRNQGAVDLWNVETGEKVSSSPEDAGAIWTIEVGPIAGDGPLLALRQNSQRSGLRGGAVRVWDAAAGKAIAELTEAANIPYAGALPVSETGGLLAHPDPDSPYAVRLFDLRLGSYRRPLLAPGTSSEPLQFGRFNRDGTVLATQEGGFNPGIRLWNTETGEVLGSLHDHENPIWSPDGRYLAASGPGRFEVPDGMRGGNRAAMVVYEVVTPTSTFSVKSRPSAVAVAANGRELAVQGQRLQIVEHRGGLRLRPSAPPTDETGRFVTTGGGLWRFRHFPEVEPGQAVRVERVFPDSDEFILADVMREEKGSPQNLAVSPDGQRLLLEWQRQVRLEDRPNTRRIIRQLELWDLSSRSRVAIWAEQPTRSVGWGVLKFSPDGKLAVTTESAAIFFRDAETGEVLRDARLDTVLESRPDSTHLKAHTVLDAAFAPDSSLLVCGGEDGRIGVINVATASMQLAWDAHAADVRAVAISPDGQMLATGGDDRMLRLWDLHTGSELAQWQPHQTGVTALQFNPSGRGLVSTAGDGTIRLWDLQAIRKELAALELDW